MSISASARDRKRIAVTGAKESGAATTPITLSERSMTGLALIRIFVGYLWFQQLFWKMPPGFRGLYPYIIRESQHTIIPGYGALLQHTFLDGRAAGGHQPDVWTLYAFGSHSCDDLIATTLCWPGVCTRGMDMDIRHAGIACTRAGGCSSRAQAGRRSMVCTTSTSSRTAVSHSAHCELAGIGREREGCDANTTQRSVGRTSCRSGAGHAQLCDGWDARTPLTGGVTLVWDHHCRPDHQSIRRLLLASRAGWGVWSHLWCAPEGEDDHDQSRAPLGACARLCLVARLLTAACEHYEPSCTFQPRFWKVPQHFSHRPAFRDGVGGNLLPTPATA